MMPIRWIATLFCLLLIACSALPPPPPEPNMEELLARERAQREQRRREVDALIPRQGPRKPAELHQVVRIYRLPLRVSEALPASEGVAALSLHVLIEADGSVSDCQHEGQAPSRAWVGLCAHVKRMHFGVKDDQPGPQRLVMQVVAGP